MSNPTQITASDTPVFHNTVTALTTSTVAHPDSWNPIHQALLDNTVVLNDALVAVNQTIDQLDTRMDGVEVTSSIALDRAMRLNWQYGSARMSLDLFTPAWSLRALNPIMVTGAVGSDDSIDLATTEGIVVGRYYVISYGATQESVLIKAVLGANRVRVTSVLQRTYPAGSKFGSTSWAVGDGLATANDGSYYFSGILNLSATLGNHMVVIRRTASPAQIRLYFNDTVSAVFRECALAQQIATGVTDTGMADYVFYVPATGDFNLMLITSGGAVNVKHIAAVTGKSTTLSGYGIGDAYTKPEVDSKVDAIPKTRVITLPTISGPTTVTPGVAFTLTATSTPRLTGATIASFDFTKPDNSKVNVVASSGSASLNLQVAGSIGDGRNVLIEAIDSEGNRSAVKTYMVTITNNNAPSMAAFSHTVPASAIQATTASVKFLGATDADGDSITYSVDPGTSGLLFSKANGIAANEALTMTVPGSVLPSKAVTFTVYAVDSKGAQTGTTLYLTIVGQTQWEFTTAGVTQWVAPATGNYEVVEIGGGAGGGTGAGASQGGAGGGSGYLFKRTFNIAAGTTLPVTVGAAGASNQNGGSTSLGTLVTAPGGNAGESMSQMISSCTKGGDGGSAGGSGSGSGMGANGGKDGSQQPYTGGGAEIRKGVSQGTGLISNLNDLAFTPGDSGVGTAVGYNCGGGAGGLLVNGTGPNATLLTSNNTDGASGGKGYGAGGGGGYGLGGTGTQGYMRLKFLGV